jgi:hypothetical protein
VSRSFSKLVLAEFGCEALAKGERVLRPPRLLGNESFLPWRWNIAPLLKIRKILYGTVGTEPPNHLRHVVV